MTARRIALALAWSMSASSLTAADPRAEAAAHYRQGKAFADAKQYDQAIAEYRKAYALDGVTSHLFNIARMLHDKGDFAAAIDHYQQYLAAEPGTPRAREVRAFIAEATRQQAAAEAKRRADDEAARIAAEQQRVEQQRRALAAQAHRKQAEAYAQAGAWGKAGDEYRAATAADGDPSHLIDAARAFREQPDLAKARDALVAYLEKVPLGERSDKIRAEVAELTRTIEKAARDREVEPPPPQPPITVTKPSTEAPSRSTRRTIGVVIGGVGVASLGVGTVFGFLAGTAKSDASKLCTEAGTCTSTGVELVDDARSKAVVANLTIGLGLAAVAGGVVLYLTAPRGSTAAHARLVPTGTGAAIIGRF